MEFGGTHNFETHVGVPGPEYDGQHEQVSSQETFLHKMWSRVDAISVTNTLTMWYRGISICKRCTSKSQKKPECGSGWMQYPIQILRQGGLGEYPYAKDAHLKTREVTQTYMCVAGGKVFGTRSNLRQHMGRHNKSGKKRMNRWTNIWDNTLTI